MLIVKTFSPLGKDIKFLSNVVYKVTPRDMRLLRLCSGQVYLYCTLYTVHSTLYTVHSTVGILRELESKSLLGSVLVLYGSVTSLKQAIEQ